MSVDIHIDGFPDRVPEHSMLYITAAQENGAQELRSKLREMSLSWIEPFPLVMQIELTADQIFETAHWTAALNQADLDAIRCRLSIDDGHPSVAQLMQSQKLSSLVAWVNGQWLIDVLQRDRLVTYFQPIVHTGSPNNVFAYECLLRGKERNGEIISPFRLFNAARSTGLLTSLDAAARMTAVESFRNCEVDIDTCVFININPRSIQDPLRNLHGTLQAIASSGLDPERFVFEIVESDEIVDLEGLMQILEFCREAGCRVALDDLGAGYSSLNLLAKIKPDFIKLDMDLIRDVDRDAYKSRVAGKLLELAKDLGVKTVAEGVETPGEWQWAMRHGADYAQGYYFARPAEVPPRPAVDVNDEQLVGVCAAD